MEILVNLYKIIKELKDLKWWYTNFPVKLQILKSPQIENSILVDPFHVLCTKT